MTEATLKQITDEWPNINGIVTEDDTPVNLFSEKQRRILTESLSISWEPGRPFMAVANVGIFYDPDEPPVVPDMFLSLDVVPPKDIWKKINRAYFLCQYRKPPEVAVEIVSDTEGDKDMQKYAQVGVRYYILYDPQKLIQDDPLRIFELSGEQYHSKPDRNLIQAGLGVTLWEGVVDQIHEVWLRWVDHEGNLILLGFEQRKLAELAKKERQAVLAEQKAEKERQKAEKLAEKLRALGIDPEG